MKGERGPSFIISCHQGNPVSLFQLSHHMVRFCVSLDDGIANPNVAKVQVSHEGFFKC